MYSIIQTAIENGLDPFRYLKLLFETMPNCTMSEVPGLLPWADAVQAVCKVGRV